PPTTMSYTLSLPDALPISPEARRRRLEGLIIVATALAVVLFAVFEFHLPQSPGPGSVGTNAVLVVLINLNMILLILLVFLVGRKDRKSTRLNSSHQIISYA